MSRMLNLVDVLLTTGRQLFLMGRFTEAIEPLTKLTGFRQLPDDAAHEVQSLLGEIHLQQKKYSQARRHLTAALAVRPMKAEAFYLMALAIDEDPQAQKGRAEMYYTRAVELEPSEPAYWADLGSYLFALGKTRPALKAIRKAFTLGISDAEIVGQVAEVLRREELFEEATTRLRAALFHNHGAQAFRQLWQHHQWHLIRAEQRAEKQHEGPPVMLPFVPQKSQGKYAELGGKTIRIDDAHAPSAPKTRQPTSYRRPPKG